MPVDQIAGIANLKGLEELPRATGTAERGAGSSFTDALKEAVQTVDGLQKQSEVAQASYAREEVDLHDVPIKIEEAEIAFKAMMEVRTKLVQAYHEVMRMGSGG